MCGAIYFVVTLKFICENKSDEVWLFSYIFFKDNFSGKTILKIENITKKLSFIKKKLRIDNDKSPWWLLSPLVITLQRTIFFSENKKREKKNKMT